VELVVVVVLDDEEPTLARDLEEAQPSRLRPRDA
jgi:hypothetical protein